MLPESFDDVQAGHSYLINLDRCIERWPIMKERVTAAGFNPQRRSASDGMDGNRRQKWIDFGARPDFIDKFEADGKSGCTLSHVYLWQHMVDNNIPFANVFEDDVLFHKNWKELAHEYYKHTDKSVDILYYGSQGAGVPKDRIITSNPIFCTHAYLITLDGAKKLLNIVRSSPYLIVVDCLIKDMMNHGMWCPFRWQCWNGIMFPDPARDAHPDFTPRNDGLVFQDGSFESNINFHAPK